MDAMSVQTTIEQKIREALGPVHLEILNESHMHSVPPGSESHFKLIIVAAEFEAMSRVRRHQTVNAILARELAGPIHALSMQTHTAAEWEQRGKTRMASPPCHGGSKADA
jgi:BolA protein